MAFFSADKTGGERVGTPGTRFFSLGLPTWAIGQDVDRGLSAHTMVRSRRRARPRRRGGDGRGGGNR